MKTKELINKTFDEVIEKTKKDKKGMFGTGKHYESQVYDEATDIKTDKNITKICKEVIK